jgi:hypothetical protein
MIKSVFATMAMAISLLASSAFADGLQINVSYGEKAEKAFSKTYGDRERTIIVETIKRSLSREVGDQATRVDVVINDIVANRPTFKQLGDRPGLSFQSFGIGGADISGKAYDAGGNLIGQVTYDWYGDIYWANTSWTWSDADRAIYGFSRRLASVVPG